MDYYIGSLGLQKLHEEKNTHTALYNQFTLLCLIPTAGKQQYVEPTEKKKKSDITVWAYRETDSEMEIGSQAMHLRVFSGCRHVWAEKSK